jgi:hypothetical protein
MQARPSTEYLRECEIILPSLHYDPRSFHGCLSRGGGFLFPLNRADAAYRDAYLDVESRRRHVRHWVQREARHHKRRSICDRRELDGSHDTDTYTDASGTGNSLTPGTTYYYVVTAVAGTAESVPSNEAQAFIPISVQRFGHFMSN